MNKNNWQLNIAESINKLATNMTHLYRNLKTIVLKDKWRGLLTGCKKLFEMDMFCMIKSLKNQ